MQRRAYGVWTGSNRSQYYAILENIMEERKDILLTQYLVEDVCGLIRKPNGRVEAGPNNHDDNIMSYLIGMFVYLFAPYEKLAQYGIHRGASDNINDYDENGNITEEGTMKKLLELYPSLPESMQDLIKTSMMQKTPVSESIETTQEIIQAKEVFQQEMMTDYGMTPGDPITPTQFAPDQAYWSQYDEDVWKSNERDPFASTFNIEDFL